jgi:hypothetical protein
MVAKNESLYLILGCFGRIDDGFTSCNSIENRILLLDNELDCYNDIISYFESIRLFDKPLFDGNGVKNCIYQMQGRFDQKVRRLWTEKEFRLYENFILSHKNCGVFLQLKFLEKEIQVHTFEKPILIKKNSEDRAFVTPPPLRVIRGRR